MITNIDNILHFKSVQIFQEKNWEIILNPILDWDEEIEDFIDDIYENSVDEFNIKYKNLHQDYIPAERWEIVLAILKNFNTYSNSPVSSTAHNFFVNLGFYTDHHKISDEMKNFILVLAQQTMNQIWNYQVNFWKENILTIKQNDVYSN